jgi:TRAP-type C4-dicarboxylate transport system permease large subunit
MIFLIVIARRMFGFFLSATGIPRTLGTFIAGREIAPWMVAALIPVIYFILGTLMDEIAILVIMTPIMYPIVTTLAFPSIVLVLPGLMG